MDTGVYTDIRAVADFPGFHDAELTGIEHDPEGRVLELRFRRVGGEVEVLRFFGVMGLRTIDFAEQNVASRLLISTRYAFSLAEVRTWVQWINSRDDSKGIAISEQKGAEYFQKLKAGQCVLFVLEPSCGAEMAVLCESLSLKLRSQKHALTDPDKTWGWHLAKAGDWLQLVLGGYSSFHDSAVRSFCLQRIRNTTEDVNGLPLPENRTRELLDLRLEVFCNRYGAPSVPGRPDYIAVLDFRDIRASNIDVNGMVEEATIMEMTLAETLDELIQLDLTPSIGLDIRLTCKEVVVVDMRPYTREV
jgi:hypothetical protein